MTSKYTPEYLKASHSLSFNNYNSIASSAQCACFYCKRLFNKDAIEDWVKTENEKTAICPHCGIDAVIGDASNAPIKDNEFIDAMNQAWF
jgi:uncharacterized CHY-type Zn-finger protein